MPEGRSARETPSVRYSREDKALPAEEEGKEDIPEEGAERTPSGGAVGPELEAPEGEAKPRARTLRPDMPSQAEIDRSKGLAVRGLIIQERTRSAPSPCSHVITCTSPTKGCRRRMRYPMARRLRCVRDCSQVQQLQVHLCTCGSTQGCRRRRVRRRAVEEGYPLALTCQSNREERQRASHTQGCREGR